MTTYGCIRQKSLFQSATDGATPAYASFLAGENERNHHVTAIVDRAIWTRKLPFFCVLYTGQRGVDDLDLRPQ